MYSKSILATCFLVLVSADAFAQSSNDVGLDVDPIAGMPPGEDELSCAVAQSFTGNNSNNVRLFRDGIPSDCPGKAFPGTHDVTGPYYYETFTHDNYSDETVCTTVNFDPNAGANPCGADAHASAYLYSFNPDNLAQNYIGDVGSSLTQPFSFDVPPFASMVLVVNNNFGQNMCDFAYEIVSLDCDDPTEDNATFEVNKTFNDGNPGDVDVTISCNTGLPLEQTKSISQGDGVKFVVTDFDDGELDCTITESIPTGYSANYYDFTGYNSDGCVFEDLPLGAARGCVVENVLDQVSIVVRKIWIDDNPQFNAPNYARADWNCYHSGYQIGADDAAFFGCDGDTCGSLSFYGADDTDSFYVYPDWDGTTYCTVEERIFESGVESSNNCGRLYVSPGRGNGCTITNTRFYEGIPTLSQYGLAILALLMLGVGMVGFRRFV
jgi:hypothetical protein